MAANVGLFGAEDDRSLDITAQRKRKVPPGRLYKSDIASWQDPIGQQGLRYLMWVLLGGILALLVFASRASGPFLAVVGAGIMVAGAALLIGAVLGFLFGIPHTVAANQQKAPQQPQANQQTAVPVSVPATENGASASITQSEARSYMPNTDLEQIADWLTKILVGVGLTELQKVPDGLAYLRGALAGEMGGNGTVAVSLALYFVLCGFLIGFLWTRLYFPQALRWSDEASEAMSRIYRLEERSDRAMSAAQTAQLAVEEAKANQDADKAATDCVARQLNPWSGLGEVSEQELRAKIGKATPLTRERIFDQAAIVRSTNWKFNKDLMLRTIPIFEALIAKDPGRFEYLGELGFALKDRGDYLHNIDDYRAAKDALDRAISLRPGTGQGAAWYEFLRAMCCIRLDEKFRTNQPTSGTTLDNITKDLQIAQRSNLTDAMVSEGEVLTTWIRCNHLETVFPFAAMRPVAESSKPEEVLVEH